MYLKLKPDNDVIKALYENHNSYHSGDSGLDLFVTETVVLPKGSLANTLDFGISCEAFVHNSSQESNVSYYLYPRSSISKTPLRMSNSVGIIDAGYRGNIIACVDNIKSESYTIKQGDRLFHICAGNLEPIEFKLVDTLSETQRGTGGFGSTGK